MAGRRSARCRRTARCPVWSTAPPRCGNHWRSSSTSPNATRGVWPAPAVARAWARSAASEMHAGFGELRNRCSMSCGLRVQLHEVTPALTADLNRLEALWSDGLSRFGGPFLAGATFSAVDAFFAPVVFRIQTYGLQLNAACQAYVELMLGRESLRSWYEAGLLETWRDASHEVEFAQFGRITQDLRATRPRRPRAEMPAPQQHQQVEQQIGRFADEPVVAFRDRGRGRPRRLPHRPSAPCAWVPRRAVGRCSCHQVIRCGAVR